jgi:uncharacterized protein YgfB (UPF0149 family)
MAGLFQEMEITRGDLIRVRVTRDEKKLIEQKAADCGMSVSQFVRQLSMGKPVRSKVVATIINDLRDLADLQKELYQQGDKRHEKEYRRILESIVAAIERVSSAKWLDF